MSKKGGEVSSIIEVTRVGDLFNSDIVQCVRVVVRVRPFNDREKALNCKSCVEVRNDSICLLKASDVNSSQHHDRHFTFDHVFDQE